MIVSSLKNYLLVIIVFILKIILIMNLMPINLGVKVIGYDDNNVLLSLGDYRSRFLAFKISRVLMAK